MKILLLVSVILSVTFALPVERPEDDDIDASQDVRELADMKNWSEMDDARRLLAAKLLKGQSFEDQAKDFILSSMKRFETKKKRQTIQPRLRQSTSKMAETRSRSLPLVVPSIPLSSDQSVDVGGPRFKRQSSDVPSATSGASDFDRILEQLGQQSSQLAEQYENLKRMTQNLAEGLRDLQEKAGVSAESLRASASTLGSDLKSRFERFAENVNSSISGLSLSDLQSGLRNILPTSESSSTSRDQTAIDSVVSEILQPSPSTTASPYDSVNRQLNQLISGATSLFRNNQSENGQEGRPRQQLDQFLSGLTNLADRFLNRGSTQTAIPGYLVTEGPSSTQSSS